MIQWISANSRVRVGQSKAPGSGGKVVATSHFNFRIPPTHSDPTPLLPHLISHFLLKNKKFPTWIIMNVSPILLISVHLWSRFGTFHNKKSKWMSVTRSHIDIFRQRTTRMQKCFQQNPLFRKKFKNTPHLIPTSLFYTKFGPRPVGRRPPQHFLFFSCKYHPKSGVFTPPTFPPHQGALLWNISRTHAKLELKNNS